ncbi:MAG: ATP-binding protein [Lachnospiraceae bacterium]
MLKKDDTIKDKKNKTGKKYFRSFRVQLTFAFIALTAICILISILVSNILLERYYGSKQIAKIEEAFETINEIGNKQAARNLKDYFDNGITLDENASLKYDSKGNYWLDQSVVTGLDKLSMIDNLKIVLFDPDLKLNSGYVYSTETSKEGLAKIIESMRGYILYDVEENESVKFIETTDKYDLYQAKDKYIDSRNYDLIGRLDNGVYCFIRMNYESIQEFANVTNNYFAYVGIGIILVEALFILIMSKNFTKPLRNMNEVAKRMTSLDFEAKASVETANEFGELAGSLNELSETLEKTILELKTANNELQTDLKRRVEIDEMRRDFLGNVSHELKTPIAIIQGYAEGLKDNINEDAESREFYCDVIIDEAAKMNTMVRKLLSLNRIEYGESQLEMERFDIVELIRGILQSSAILAGDRDIKVVFDETEPCFVYADEYMIEESVSNYVSNAYHYVSAENRIEISLHKHDGLVRVSVFNSGSNIPEEDLDKVWIKFYKVDKARTREYGGTGIGLSIVKAVMELHNQSCGVINRDGGVEFWLELDSSPGVECHAEEEKEEKKKPYTVRLKD